MNKHPEEIKRETKERLKLQDELLARRKRIRASYEKNRLNLIGVQTKVADVLKPVINPLKKIDERQQQLANQSNQLALTPQQKQYQYFKSFNVKPLPLLGITDKLNAGIRPGISENDDGQYQFNVGKKIIDINFNTEIINIGTEENPKKIKLTQDLMNLINGDDGEIIRPGIKDKNNKDIKDPDKVFTKYENHDYIDYYDILVHVKGRNSNWGERLKMLDKKVEKILAEEIDDISALDVDVDEEDLSNPINQENLINDISRELELPVGSGLSREKINDILDKLALLISAKKEGHNNLDDKIAEILDKLKKYK